MRHGLVGVLLLSSLGLLAEGCAAMSRAGPAPACVRLRSAYAGLSAEQLAAERRWVETALEEGAPTAEPQLHLRLGLLMLHHRNPEPDYAGALRHLRAYAESDPAAENCSEVADWVRGLAALLAAAATQADRERAEALELEARELSAEVRNLRSENRQLRKRVDAAREGEERLADEVRRVREQLAQARKDGEELSRRNARLQDRIDKLQYLDFQMERKRRAMK